MTLYRCAFLLIPLLLLTCTISYTQVIYHDGIIRYHITVSGEKLSEGLKDSELTVYLRGMLSKSEVITPMGKSITFYDEKKGLATQLNEYGHQRTMIKMNDSQYQELNRSFADYTIEKMSDTKKIEGYTCQQAKILFKNSQTITVYYTPDLVFQTTYNPLHIKLPGFPLEFETESSSQKIIYKAKFVSTYTVPSSQFDIQEKDYMEIEYNKFKKN